MNKSVIYLAVLCVIMLLSCGERPVDEKANTIIAPDSIEELLNAEDSFLLDDELISLPLDSALLEVDDPSPESELSELDNELENLAKKEKQENARDSGKTIQELGEDDSDMKDFDKVED